MANRYLVTKSAKVYNVQRYLVQYTNKSKFSYHLSISSPHQNIKFVISGFKWIVLCPKWKRNGFRNRSERTCAENFIIINFLLQIIVFLSLQKLISNLDIQRFLHLNLWHRRLMLYTYATASFKQLLTWIQQYGLNFECTYFLLFLLCRSVKYVVGANHFHITPSHIWYLEYTFKR